jgi:hypothetical protein
MLQSINNQRIPYLRATTYRQRIIMDECGERALNEHVFECISPILNVGLKDRVAVVGVKRDIGREVCILNFLNYLFLVAN